MTDSIELVVADLDGTLLDQKHEITERAAQAIKALREQNIKFMLATGKSRSSALKIIEQLELDTPGVFVQGLVLQNADGSIRTQITLEPAIARQAITFAEDRGFSVVAYSGTTTYVRKRTHDTNLIVEYGEPESEVVGPLQNLLGSTPINKLAFIDRDDPRRVKALRWQLNMQFNGAATLVQPAVAQMLELLPKGTSKGAGLKTLLKDMGIDPKNVMAVGDGENDIEMLQLAGIGVAVANADEHVRKAANHVTTASYGDGLAEAIERFALKPKPADDALDAVTLLEETTLESENEQP
jgi:Cof subfamily protein (haloacid dehalogenase superfamily)